MSARLCADVDSTETWYTAFTDVLKSLIFKDKQESNLTCDQISEAILSVENVTMLVDGSSNYVKDILKPEPLNSIQTGLFWSICDWGGGGGGGSSDPPSVSLEPITLGS